MSANNCCNEIPATVEAAQGLVKIKVESHAPALHEWANDCRHFTTHVDPRTPSGDARSFAVDLRTFLQSVGQTYDPSDGFDTPAQQSLREAPIGLADYAPAEFLIRASGGQRPLRTTDTPWVGFFDPDETTRPQEGLYVVWLLRADRSAWTLSLNMGTERRSAQLKALDDASAKPLPREPRVLAGLAAEASAIRHGMLPEVSAPWDSAIDLRRAGLRQRRYEAATVIARTYPLATLPNDDELRSDVVSMCNALQEAIRAKRDLALTEPGSITTPTPIAVRDERTYEFEPGTDIQTTVAGRTVERRPRHEGGLRRYGEWLIGRGVDVATNVHPRDFVIRGDVEWIGEYKVIYGVDETRATREAHSQLKEYRYFGYPADPAVPLLAVFSGAVSPRRIAWLNSEGIAVAYWTGAKWAGCPIARAAGLGE